MNHNQSQKMKRIVSGMLSLTMITSMSTILPANAETVSSLALDGLAVNNYGYTNVEGIVSDDVVTDIEGTGITIKGDVNSDGKITDDDRELLNKWLTRSIGDNELDLKNADVNLDGKVNVLDLVELSRLCDTVKKTTSEQQIGKDSEILSEINTEDNAFNVSVDITAAGDAQTLLSADESRYSSAIKSNIVVGVVPELEYEEGYAVDEVTLNFDIKNELTDDGKYASVSDDFKGVRKFNVFKYFEDIDMLLPIETNYDTESNTVTTTVDELGTYCLVDMEKWFETLGIKPEELATENTAPSSVNMMGTSETTAVESRSANTVGTAGIPVDQPIINSVASTAVTEPGPLDVIIQVYVNGTSSGLRNAQNDVLNTANKLFDEYGENGTLRVYVANYNGTLGKVNKKYYATSKEEAAVLASNLPDCKTTEPPEFFDCVSSLTDNYNNSDSKRPDTDTYHVFVDRSGIEINYSHEKAQSFIDNTIKKVFVTNYSEKEALANYINGYYRESASGYGDEVSEYIIKEHGSGNKGDDDKFDYPIITATGWKRIELDAPISKDYEDISNKIRQGEEPREKYTSDYADTDKDGLLDLEEIKYLVVDKIFGKDIRVTWDKNGNVVLPTLAQVMQTKFGLPYIGDSIKGIPLEYFGDFRILPLKSDPTNSDGDNDGVIDNNDLSPLSTYFSGTMSDSYFDNYRISFRFDYTSFFDNNTIYKKDLAVLGSILANLAYIHDDGEKKIHTSISLTKGVKVKDKGIEEFYSTFGLDDYEDYRLSKYYNDDDISEMMIGHRNIELDGSKKEIIVVSVRGTDGTIEEWSSNFDVGADTDDYWDRDNEYWRNKKNHKGFDVAANRLYDHIIDYVNSNTDKESDKIIYIVGHSRGAAIANILGSKFEENNSYKSFVYTYASPETTTDLFYSDYRTIFNIVNTDDLVPQLPLKKWGFRRYGVTKSASIRDSYEGDWQKQFDIFDYNYNGNLNDTIKAMEQIAENREDLYRFSNDDDCIYKYRIQDINSYDILQEIENRKNKYGERISRHCQFDSETSRGSTYLCVNQSPAAFMMILADLTAGYYHDKEINPYCDLMFDYNPDHTGEEGLPEYGIDLGFYVAPKYSNAKKEFIHSGIDSMLKTPLGGMVNAHMTATYYFLSKDCRNILIEE